MRRAGLSAIRPTARLRVKLPYSRLLWLHVFVVMLSLARPFLRPGAWCRHQTPHEFLAPENPSHAHQILRRFVLGSPAPDIWRLSLQIWSCHSRRFHGPFPASMDWIGV